MEKVTQTLYAQSRKQGVGVYMNEETELQRSFK